MAIRLGWVLAAALVSCSPAPAEYAAVIRGGMVYDGDGGEPYQADIAIVGDRIAEVGDLSGARGHLEIDARGLAVAPGFVNMLSWATESLIEDGRSESDIRQGVTLEIFGEGNSMGPLNDQMKRDLVDQQGDIRYPVQWTTLGEYLEFLEKRGVSPNVASFVGATTVRIHELGRDDRRPSAEELGRMQDLVRAAMEEGALGVGSSLIYAPAFYADTAELIALCQAAAPYGGVYISHMRSEGNRLLEAIDELIAISREAGVPAEIYHLKAAGMANWDKLDAAIAKIEAARADGLPITADMYNYTAGATGLDAAMPPWVQEGGLQAWIARLHDPATRARVAEEMRQPADHWENLLRAAGSPDNVLLVGFKNDALKPLTGKSLAEVAMQRGTSPEEAAMDLVIEDGSRVGAIYFLMSEDNVRRQIALPWVSFGSDEASQAPEGNFLKSNPHPRAYGNVARLLGKYVRDERIITLQEAVRRLTSLPADNLKLTDRGRLKAGHYADLAIFHPERVNDVATYAQPQRYAEGMAHVFVNGVQVLADGKHTGATPGRVVRGKGWKPRRPLMTFGWRSEASTRSKAPRLPVTDHSGDNAGTRKPPFHGKIAPVGWRPPPAPPRRKVFGDEKDPPHQRIPEWLPEQRLVEQEFLERIRGKFELFGFTPIETRSVEPLDQLLEKGETDKEIYLLKRLQADDEEDAQLALHFDLTVPLARYVCQFEHHLQFPGSAIRSKSPGAANGPRKAGTASSTKPTSTSSAKTNCRWISTPRCRG